jgi:hypothetical protein
MTEDVTPTVARRCPWCSEPLPESATDRCPSCQANLVAEGEARIAGLTEVEAPIAARARRTETPKRSKLLSWISGEVDDVPALQEKVAPDALALPPRDVRREMLRLKLEAEGLTVTADGAIELPAADARPIVADASPEPGPAGGPDVEPTSDEEIRKAS